MHQLAQDPAYRTGVDRVLIGLLDLTEYLRFSDYQRIQARCDPEQVFDCIVIGVFV
jgi:hypothetical protein